MTFRTYLVILAFILGVAELSSYLLGFRNIPTLNGQELASENSKGVANDLSTFGMRTWKDASGKFSILASFVDLESGKVQLRRQNQEIVVLPLARLCSADQEYVKFHSNPDNLLLSAFGIDSYSKLETYCKSHNKPQEIVDIIQAFVECEALPSESRDRAKLLLPKWVAIIDEKRILFGKQWVPQSEYDRIIAEESKLVKEAWKLIDAGQDKAAQERLEQASKIHPLSIRADFNLGLMHALIHRQALKAEEYFNECVKRQNSFRRPVEDVSTANLAAALNNLAITEIRQAKHKDAFKHLREAARLNPASPEILQNVGRYSDMVKSQRLKSVPPSMHEDLSNLFASIVVSAGNFEFQPQKGWLYMRLVDEAKPVKSKTNEETSKSQISSSSTESSNRESTRRIVSGASGFVIQDGYVLTNRHVVEGADGYSILDAETQQELPASLIAVSDSTDFSAAEMLKFRGAALPLATSPMRRGTDIIVFGFPLLARFGATLKTTRGTVTGLPAKETNQMCMLDAAANTGNSGGPICDPYGQVIAVLTKGTTEEVHNYTFGIPADSIRQFVKGQLPNYQSPNASKEKMDWADVDAQVSPSTVLIFTEQELMKTGMESRTSNVGSSEGGSTSRATPPAGSNAFEDSWCMTCNGHGRVECPIRGCARGTVKDFRTDQVGRNPITGERILQNTPIRVKCKKCNGKGDVDCNQCTNGRE